MLKLRKIDEGRPGESVTFAPIELHPPYKNMKHSNLAEGGEYDSRVCRYECGASEQPRREANVTASLEIKKRDEVSIPNQILSVRVRIPGATPGIQPSFPAAAVVERDISTIFITALPLEFNAISRRMSRPVDEKLGGTVVRVGVVNALESRGQVAVVQLGGMGNPLAGIVTQRILAEYRPRNVVFIGVAGGLKEDELRLGDVVAASKIYGYESGKAGADYFPRPLSYDCDHGLVQRACVVVSDGRWSCEAGGGGGSSGPRAYVKPVAAGDKVISSGSAVEYGRVKKFFSDAYAVAMEDLGFAMAAHHNRVPFLSIRGISDLVDNKSQADAGGWQEKAVANATIFAFELLREL